jgi:hypothetical protein
MTRHGVTLVLAMILIGLASRAPADLALAVEASADITVDLSGTVVSDDELASDDLLNPVAPFGYPGVPASADVDAHTFDLDGNDVISLDTTVALPAVGGGTLTARPSDVVRLKGGAYELVFDAAAAGVPSGVNTDAVFVQGRDLLMSFDVSVGLDGAGVADDEDVVRWNGSALSLQTDTSALGVSAAADLDALHYLPTGALVASFDTGGAVGGLTYDDDDLLFYDPVAGAWTLSFDGAAEHPGWQAADIDAATPGYDVDDDGTLDGDDLCPRFAGASQTDTDGNGIGDDCECGDQSGDGTVDVNDILAVNAAIFNPSLVTPLCDTNDDALCDVSDILGVNAKIFGAPAYCSRYPAPVFP